MIGVSDIVKEIGTVRGITNCISVITGGSITNMLQWREYNPLGLFFIFLGFLSFMFLFGIMIQHFITNLTVKYKWKLHG